MARRRVAASPRPWPRRLVRRGAAPLMAATTPLPASPPDVPEHLVATLPTTAAAAATAAATAAAAGKERRTGAAALPPTPLGAVATAVP